MTAPNYAAAIAALTGKSIDVLFGQSPLVVLKQDASGVLTVASWDASLGAAPTVAQITAALAAGPTSAQLRAYAAAKADGLIAAIRSVAASGVAIKSTSTDSAIGKLAALATWGAANPTSSTIWTADDLSTVTVTGAQLAAAAPLALAYSMSIYGAALPTVLAEIGSGAITTTAQIDAYAWPV